MRTRNAAITALLSVITSAYAWTTAPSLRLKLWGDVPAALRPCAFLYQGGKETYVWQQGAAPRRAIECKLFIYTDCSTPDSIGAEQLNDIMDAIDEALAPDPTGQNTLGNTVASARIDGDPFKDPGDLDGSGMLIVPIRLLIP